MCHQFSLKELVGPRSAFRIEFLYHCCSFDEGDLPFGFEIESIGEYNSCVRVNCRWQNLFDLAMSFIVHPSKRKTFKLYFMCKTL